MRGWGADPVERGSVRTPEGFCTGVRERDMASFRGDAVRLARSIVQPTLR